MSKLMTRERLEELGGIFRDRIGFDSDEIRELLYATSALMVEVARQDVELQNILQEQRDSATTEEIPPSTNTR